MEAGALIQTISILAVGIVFLAKMGHEMIRSRRFRNGTGGYLPGRERDQMIAELHEWHKPQPGPKGQPTFRWYTDCPFVTGAMKEYQDSMKDHQVVVEKLREEIEKLRQVMEQMIEALKETKVGAD